jgi:hypothetical protein
MEKTLEKARAISLERQHLQVRLSDVFLTAPSLYTEKEGLVVVFDQGVDPDPRFSGLLTGKLYLEKGNLVLKYFPQEKMKKRPWRKEKLLSNVDKVSLTFWKEDSWKQEWNQKEHLPGMIRMEVCMKEETLCYAFLVPSVEQVCVL